MRRNDGKPKRKRIKHVFSIKEVAFIFGRSGRWIESADRAGEFRHEDGTRLEFARSPSDSIGRPGSRLITLDDIVVMAHSTHRRGLYTDQDLADTLKIVDALRIRDNKLK